MLYYLLLIPAVLSTAWIYFLSPALSYWWLLPILIACFVAANLVYVLLMFVCTWFAGPNKMYTHISPFYHALTMALDGWILTPDAAQTTWTGDIAGPDRLRVLGIVSRYTALIADLSLSEA